MERNLEKWVHYDTKFNPERVDECNTIHIFHHYDNDGIVAAGVVVKRYLYFDNFKFYSIKYENVFDTTDIKPNDIVFIVDFNIGEKQLESLYEIIDIVGIDKVVWIDHHKSTIEEEHPELKDIFGYRYIGYSGAMLTYFYLIKISLSEYQKICIELGKDFDDIPKNLDELFVLYYSKCSKFLKLIDDYDCWKKLNNGDQDIFKLGFEAKYKNITKYSDWLNFICDEIEIEQYVWEPFYRSIYKHGKVIQTVNTEKYKNAVNNLSFEYDIKGYKALVLNFSERNSIVFGDKINDYDICCVYNYNGKVYTYSLYTAKPDIDVSIIAKSLDSNGGGHKGAAGFIKDYNIFSKK